MYTIVRFCLAVLVALIAFAQAKTGAGQNMAYKGGAGQNLAHKGGAGQNLAAAEELEHVLFKKAGAGQGLSVNGALLNAAGFAHESKAENFIKYAKGITDG